MNGDFTLYTPTKVVFGHGVEKNAGAMVKAFGGKKVLIHYGGKSAVQSGLLKRVQDSLTAEDIDYVSLGGLKRSMRA